MIAAAVLLAIVVMLAPGGPDPRRDLPRGARQLDGRGYV